MKGKAEAGGGAGHGVHAGGGGHLAHLAGVVLSMRGREITGVHAVAGECGGRLEEVIHGAAPPLLGLGRQLPISGLDRILFQRDGSRDLKEEHQDLVQESRRSEKHN